MHFDENAMYYLAKVLGCSGANAVALYTPSKGKWLAFALHVPFSPTVLLIGLIVMVGAVIGLLRWVLLGRRLDLAPLPSSGRISAD